MDEEETRAPNRPSLASPAVAVPSSTFSVLQAFLSALRTSLSLHPTTTNTNTTTPSNLATPEIPPAPFPSSFLFSSLFLSLLAIYCSSFVTLPSFRLSSILVGPFELSLPSFVSVRVQSTSLC